MTRRSNPLPACVVCDRECIPLADYDAAVCHRCDDTYAQALARARFAVPAAPAPRPALIPAELIQQLGAAWDLARERKPAA